jgi:hypothetical protein
MPYCPECGKDHVSSTAGCPNKHNHSNYPASLTNPYQIGLDPMEEKLDKIIELLEKLLQKQ